MTRLASHTGCTFFLCSFFLFFSFPLAGDLHAETSDHPSLHRRTVQTTTTTTITTNQNQPTKQTNKQTNKQQKDKEDKDIDKTFVSLFGYRLNYCLCGRSFSVLDTLYVLHQKESRKVISKCQAVLLCALVCLKLMDLKLSSHGILCFSRP